MATGAQLYVKLLLLLPIISSICGENCIFLFSLDQLRPKLHSKFCGRNLEMRESPNLRKYTIVNCWKKGLTLNFVEVIWISGKSEKA